MNTLFLRGLRAQVLLGVYEWEKIHPQEVLIDLELVLENYRAGRTDCVKDAVDYSKLTGCLRKRLSERSFGLIEALAEDVADFLLEYPQAQSVAVTVTKPGILAKVASVGISIRRTKNEDSNTTMH